MRNRSVLLVVCLAATALVGCAVVNVVKPSTWVGPKGYFGPTSRLIEQVPTVQIGAQTPKQEDYIVFIPAGKEFPLSFVTDGSLFSKRVVSTAMVSLSRNLYIYKQYISLDGKSWSKSENVLKVDVNGGVVAEGGKVDLKIDVF